MKRGDRVYAAAFDGGEVAIAALTVKSVGRDVTVAERCAPLGFAARVDPGRLAESRREALVHLVARAEAEQRAAVSALARASKQLATARACLAKAEKDGMR